MDSKFTLLTEHERMWAEMLIQVLKDHDIPVISEPVLGAGFSIKTGAKERLKVFVPNEQCETAKDLMQQLFPTEGV